MSFPTGQFPPTRGPAAEGVLHEQQRSLWRRAPGGPSVFSVKARGRRALPGGGISRAKGSLMVASDAVVFHPLGRRAAHDEFPHTESNIRVMKARWGPPWSNTVLVLKNRRGSMRVSVSAFRRRGLLRALDEADVDVGEESVTRVPSIHPARGRSRGAR